MADKTIEEAAAATAQEGGAVILIPNAEAEAEEHAEEIPPVDPVSLVSAAVEDHEHRIRTMEGRFEIVEAKLAQASVDLAGKADAGHEHPVDEDLRMLSEEFQAMREEEVAPRRSRFPSRGWLHRKLKGET